MKIIIILMKSKEKKLSILPKLIKFKTNFNHTIIIFSSNNYNSKDQIQLRTIIIQIVILNIMKKI